MMFRAVAVLLLIVSVSAQIRDKISSVDSGAGATKREMPGGIELDTRKEGMDISQLKDLDTSRLRAAVGQMSEGDRDMLCQRAIKGGADDDMLDNLKAQGADCIAAMKRNPSFKPKGGEAETAMKKMREDKAPANWDDSDWTVALRQMPGAVKADDLKKMSRDTTRKMVESGDLRDAVKSFRKPSEKRALEEQLKTAYGQPEAWDKAALEKMGSMLGVMAPDTLDKIPKEKMREAASSLKDVEFDDTAKKMAAGRKLVEGMGKDRVKQWSAEDVKNADQYIRKNPKIVSQLSDDAMTKSLSDLGARPTEKSGAALLAKRLKKMDEFKNPEQVDSAKLTKMGQLSKGMGLSYLRKLPKDALEGAKGMLANVTFDPSEAREIVGKIKGNLRDYTGDKLRELSELAIGLEPEDLEEIPDAAIEDAMEDIADKEFDMSQCRAIVKKVKGKKGMIKKMGKLVSKCMSLKDLKDADVDDLGLACDTDSAPSFKIDKPQAKMMFKQIVKRFGKPSKTNRNYTLSCMRNWGAVAAHGMEPEELKDLPDNGDMKAVFENLAMYEEHMDDSQTKAVSERLREYLQMDDARAAANHDSATIEQVGVFLKHFNDADLQKFSQGVLPDVARKMGEANLEKMRKSDKNRLKDFALKHVKRDDTNRVTDRRRVANLDDNDLRDMENLLSGLEEGDVRRMDKTAMKNNMMKLNDKVRDLDLQKAVWTNAKAKDPQFLADSENVIAMAGLSGGLKSDVLDSMDKSVLGESLADVSEVMEKRSKKDARRDMAGFRKEVPTGDRDTMDRQKKAFVQKALEGYLESEDTSSRKRRQAVRPRALTCADIQTLGSNADSLLPAQIAALANDEFSDCAETLGKVTSWGGEQLDKLGAKAKEAFGKTSDWTAPQMKMIGSVAAGLNATDIEEMMLNATSLLVNMGKSDKFSMEQMKAAFSSLKANKFKNDISNITGDDLMAMGNLVCGADASEIENFPVDAFRTAMGTIGKLSCNMTKMGSFAKLAQKALGKETGWDEAMMGSLGKVVAALEPEQIRDLTPQQMRALSPDVISSLPDRAMAMLRSEQLNIFSESQASAITDDQKASMSSALRELLGGKLPNITKEMRDSLMDAVTKRVMPGGIELDANRNGMDISQLKNLDPSMLEDAVKQMSESDRDMLCQRAIQGGADASMLQELKNKGADCVMAMRRDPTFKPEGGQAETALKQMREEKAPTQWDDSDWTVALRQMPSAIKADDLRQMSTTTMRAMLDSGDLREASASFQNPSEKRALESQLKQAYGQPDAWNSTTLEKMGPLLGTMKPDTLRSIPKEQMRSAAASFKDIEFDDPSLKAAAGRSLVEALGKDNAAGWTGDDIKNSDQYIRNNPKIVSQLSEAALESSLQDLGARKTDKRGAAQLGKRLKEMNDYKNPEQVDSTKVAKMGHLIQGMGADYLGRLSSSAISGALSTLANVTLPRGDARSLVAKIKGTPSEYTSDKLMELGELVVGLEPEDLDAMPASAVGSAIETLAEKDFDKSQCRAIVKKVKASGKANMKKMGRLMSKCMSPDDLKDASLDDLGLACDSDSAPSITPDKAQSKTMFKLIKARFGNPSKTNANYSLSCMKNWGRIAALGMEPADFEELPDNGDMKSVIEKLAEHEADMDDGQTKAIAKRLRVYLNMDNATAAALHDSTTIEQVGVFLKHFNDSDLESFAESVRPDVARKLGEANHDNQPRDEKRRLKNFALKNVKRDDTNAVTDRRSATTLDDNDLRDMGTLFGGMEEADMTKMDKTSMENNIVMMNDKIRDLAVQRAGWTNARAKLPEILNTTEVIVGAAGLVGGLPSDILNEMDKSVMGEALADAATMMETRGMQDAKRDGSGYRAEVSDADRATLKAQMGDFTMKAFEGYLEGQTASSAARRRRQTTTITCSDVQVLGSNAVSLTTTQLDTLSNTDFTDCTETLGAITGWSSSQLSALAAKAKTVYGGVGTWTAANIKLIGTMTAGLTDAEISSLDLSSASVLATMGTSTAFSSTQLKAGFARFLERTRSNTASSVTGDDLITIGNFACGAETSHISSFTQAEFTTAVSSIGQLTTCDASQLSAYATLARTAYGAPSTWDSATVTSLGSIVAGLTSSEVAALTTSQISALSTSSIAQIPASNFASFSSTQLSSFTSAQANAVTSSQQNALTTSQLAALTGAGASDLTTAPNNGAGVAKISLLSVVATIAVFFL